MQSPSEGLLQDVLDDEVILLCLSGFVFVLVACRSVTMVACHTATLCVMLVSAISFTFCDVIL